MNRLSVAYAWVLCALTVAPALGMLVGVERDGYPFSTYPMFSRQRPTMEARFYVAAVGPQGDAYIPSSFWKKGHFNEGWAAINTASQRKRPEKVAFCEGIAQKIAENTSPRWAGVTHVAFRRGRFRNDEVFGANPTHAPTSFTEIVRCPVLRPLPEAAGAVDADVALPMVSP